ncbi:MAG: prepilin peptidase [Spartobacteria bacterium]|nr:prepilin peptidase [Spartobacteria bacterium]
MYANACTHAPAFFMLPVSNIICVTYLLISGIFIVYYDLRFNSIPNYLTYAGIVLGLVLLVFTRRTDCLNYIMAFLIGGGLFYAMFLCGWFGGGDVKLVAMIGILMGSRFLLDAMLYMTLAGGCIAVLYIIEHLYHRKPLRGAKIPYGTAIVAGAYFTLFNEIMISA